MERRLILLLSLSMTGSAVGADVKSASAVQEPQLREELLRRAKDDQKVRGDVTQWMMQFGNSEFADPAAFEARLRPAQKAEFEQFRTSMVRIDAENTKRLGEIIDRFGWPTKRLVGADGANAAWLIVQHADLNPQFQRKCLDLMAKAPRDEIARQDFAYLTDRVLLAEGKKQVYGTQFNLINGKCIPKPLEDADQVDARRKEAGLPPLADYLREAESIYAPPPAKPASP